MIIAYILTAAGLYTSPAAVFIKTTTRYACKKRNGYTYAYTYYLDGNQKTKTDHNGKVTSYSYDGLGRVSSEAETGGNTMAYTYDLFGNRSTLTVTGTESYTVSYSYDLNNRLLSDEKVTGDVTVTTSYTYDANGNQIIKETSTFAPAGTATNSGISLSGDIDPVSAYGYNGFNQMVSAYDNGHTMTYSYRPDGLRLSKMVDNVTTTHIWDGQNIIAESGTDGTIIANYIRGVNLIAAKKSGGLSYYLYNAHGDVVQLTDTTGTVSRIYDYDAFGNEKTITGQTGTDTNPFRYCGEYKDSETGTIYLRARYYDPVVGRFTQRDTVFGVANKLSNGQSITDPLSLNLYTYCYNNPVMYIDPDGNRVTGVGASVSTGTGLYASGEVYLVWDDEGHVGILVEVGVGAGVSIGLGYGSISTFVYEDMDNISELNKWGLEISAGAGGVNVGYQASIFGEEQAYQGIECSLGIKNVIDFHGIITYSHVVELASDNKTAREIIDSYNDLGVPMTFSYDEIMSLDPQGYDPVLSWMASQHENE